MIKPSPWMRYVLIAAAILNVACGAWAALFPLNAFALAGLSAPAYPEVWQFAGVLLFAWGVAYAMAATDPLRHWAVIAAGLGANVLAPAGFALAAARGRIPWPVTWPVIVGDLVWCVPFGLMLKAAYDAHVGALRSACPEVLTMAMRSRTDDGITLQQLSRHNPVLLVFLRHAGCTFCREALADIAKQRRDIEAAGAQIVLVHMGEPDFGRDFFRKYELGDLPQISNPNQALYRAFGLRRGSLGALLGPRVWFRGLHAALLEGHGVGKVEGDAFQMPGIFLIFHGQVLRSYRHLSAADRPKYSQFVRLDVGEPVL